LGYAKFHTKITKVIEKIEMGKSLKTYATLSKILRKTFLMRI
jgi:hypothetical protein